MFGSTGGLDALEVIYLCSVWKQGQLSVKKACVGTRLIPEAHIVFYVHSQFNGCCAIRDLLLCDNYLS